MIYNPLPDWGGKRISVEACKDIADLLSHNFSKFEGKGIELNLI